MNSTALLHGALPQVASVAVFVLACRAYLQQRSFGFLLLVFGFGIGALLASVSLISFFGGPALIGEWEAQIPGLRLATIFGPGACYLFGFLLLGKGGGASAPKSKSKASSD